MGLATALAQASVGGSVFSPAQLQSLLTLWVYGGAGISPAGGPVATWADQSGNGHNLTQATGTKQPTFNATGAPNNLPCVTADGVTQFLSGTVPLTQPYEVFAVAKWVSGTAGTLMDGNGGNNARCWQGSSGTLDFSTDASTDTIGHISLTLTAWSRLNIQVNGTTSAGSWGATPFVQISGTGAGTVSATSLFLYIFGNGSADPGNISIAEFIVCNQILSAANRALFTGYLQSKYGIA